MGVEIALASFASAASFALVGATVVAAESDLLIALLAAVYVIGVAVSFRLWGVAYGIPIAVAVLIAIDWYWVPPTHPASFPDAGNLADLLAYLAGGMLIAELAAHAKRGAAISESARSELGGEQAALRRVATLVARREPPDAVFAAVAEEAGVMLNVDGARVVRFIGEDEILQLEGWTAAGLEPLPVGPLKLENTSLATEVMRTGRAVLIEDYASLNRVVPWFVQRLGIRSGVAAPIFVEGDLWGAVVAWSLEPQPLAPNADRRLVAFTELVGMAISNAASREELALLAREQEALRRVATLVARGASPPEVFEAVSHEVGLLIGVNATWLARFDSAGGGTNVGSWSVDGTPAPVDVRIAPDDTSIVASVLRTGRPARVENYDDASGHLAANVRRFGVRSAVGAPIMVDGRLWGAMIAASGDPEPLGPATESKIAAFTELVATAISNVQARSELAASRARIVAATDEERREVVRDLHDGAQQRLVHTVVTLKLARRALQNDGGGAPALVAEALKHAEEATAELRELAHGILPSVLTRGGLRAGVVALAARMQVPVDIGISVERFPSAVEATAYFIVAEALTNVAKHAHARHAEVTARVTDGALQVHVRDDGVGGASPEGGGLLGLADRLGVLDGSLRVDSPHHGGTLIAAEIPIC
jgi:signal transduction histidine kinase